MSDTAGRTLGVAAVLCGVCSVLVASAVVALKPMQDRNKELDYKRNILMSAGLLRDGVDIDEAFKQVQPMLVNVETGEVLQDQDPNTFDQAKFERDPKNLIELGKSDKAGIKRIGRVQQVYLVKKEGEVDQIVLNVYGKGLWSTMRGFLALDKDTVTIRGFNYYSHGETPGLGGEVDNPKWIAQWPGKKAYTEDFKPAIRVAKGGVPENHPQQQHMVDGLSGATLTAVGVENTFQFWLSENGYGKFLANVRDGGLQ